jgi:ubiquinone biosynthesis protein
VAAEVAFALHGSVSMAISLRPKRLSRYKDIATLALKYARGGVLENAQSDPLVADAEPDDDELEGGGATHAKGLELASDLERLGPTFVKLGQLLSSRADLLPTAYLDALRRLQDDVEPFPYEEVESIVESELGVRISKAFQSFDRKPLAAGAGGPVHHRAVLRDGREVAVKVQRPDIRPEITEDLEAFHEIARVLTKRTEVGSRFDFERVLEEFRRTLLRELDYRQEAQNMKAMRESLREFPRLVVPRPVDDYTTARVLTMDFVSGVKLTALSPLVRLDVDGAALAEELFQAYLKQFLVNGFFHADPHPGNVLLTPEGRIALLDLGMVSRVSSELRGRLLKLVIAMGEGKGDEVAVEVEAIGEKLETFDAGRLRRQLVDLVGASQHATLGDHRMGRIVLDTARLAADAGLRVPPELVLLGKTLLHLDEIGRSLDPAFDPNASVRRNSGRLLRELVQRSGSAGGLQASLLEAKDLLSRLPERINRVLDLLSSNSLKVKVDAIDERELVAGLQKIANRIALGLVLAALIVGAALLMQVPTSFRIFGYPGLAMILFLAAAAGGGALAASIVVYDRKQRKKPLDLSRRTA